MATFTGSNSNNDWMVPVWKLAKANNEKQKVVTRRVLKKESDSRIFVRGV